MQEIIRVEPKDAVGLAYLSTVRHASRRRILNACAELSPTAFARAEKIVRRRPILRRALGSLPAKESR